MRRRFVLVVFAVIAMPFGGCGKPSAPDPEAGEPTRLPSGAAAIRVEGAPHAPESRARSLDGWSNVTNPDGDCTIRPEKGQVTITIPGTHHNLNPLIGRNNAPRVLREVEGDFTAQVRVTGEFDPGERSTLTDGAPFNGAGLVLWQDDRNFLRLERNAWRVPANAEPVCYPPLLEYYEDGRYLDTNPPAAPASFFKGSTTYLRLQRRGDSVSTAYSHDGQEWFPVKAIKVGLSGKVQVGIAAVSTSTKPFTVKFEGFTLSSDP
jgi:hypothetical protein